MPAKWNPKIVLFFKRPLEISLHSWKLKLFDERFKWMIFEFSCRKLQIDVTHDLFPPFPILFQLKSRTFFNNYYFEIFIIRQVLKQLYCSFWFNYIPIKIKFFQLPILREELTDFIYSLESLIVTWFVRLLWDKSNIFMFEL